MITQHYKLSATNVEDFAQVRPGQFVFEDDDSDEIIGFVDFTSDIEIAIMLFEPREINLPTVTSISETCDWLPRIKEILDQDPVMREMWKV